MWWWDSSLMWWWDSSSLHFMQKHNFEVTFLNYFLSLYFTDNTFTGIPQWILSLALRILPWDLMDLLNPSEHSSTCRMHFIILLFNSHFLPDSGSVNRCFVSHWISGLLLVLSKTPQQSVIPTLVWLFFSYPVYSRFWFWWFWLYRPTIFTLLKNILKIVYLKNYYFSLL